MQRQARCVQEQECRMALPPALLSTSGGSRHPHSSGQLVTYGISKRLTGTVHGHNISPDKPACSLCKFVRTVCLLCTCMTLERFEKLELGCS